MVLLVSDTAPRLEAGAGRPTYPRDGDLWGWWTGGIMEDYVGRDECARCHSLIEGEPIKGNIFGRPILRCLDCAKELAKRGRIRNGEDPGVIDVAPGFCETTAKYHSRCYCCRGKCYSGRRMVWKRGTRITMHPRCWRMKGQFLEWKK